MPMAAMTYSFEEKKQMLKTTNGMTVDAAISTTLVHISRSDKPEQEWNPVVIVSFTDDQTTEALLTDPTLSTLQEEQETETTILATTYYLDGMYQVMQDAGQTYVWYWLNRVETSERVNPAVQERLKLQENRITDLQLALCDVYEQTLPTAGGEAIG